MNWQFWKYFKEKKKEKKQKASQAYVPKTEVIELGEEDKFSAAASAKENAEKAKEGRQRKMSREKSPGDRIVDALLPGLAKIRKSQVWVSRFFFFLLVAIVVFPLFIILHRLIPNPELKFPIDRILIFLVLQCGVFYLFRKIKYIIWTVLLLGLLTLSVTSLASIYTYSDLVWDYRGLVYLLADEGHTLSEALSERPFPKYRKFLKAAKFTPEVRTYALKAAKENFEKEQTGTIGQYVKYFAIFKDVNKKWKYVSDPRFIDYVASANESIETFSGDCDDYAVLMAAAISSIGGTVRLVRTETHVYPELKIESKEDFKKVKEVIRKKLFPKESKGKDIHFHEDGHGNIWLNLDYTGLYPGSEFMADEILSILVIR